MLLFNTTKYSIYLYYISLLNNSCNTNYQKKVQEATKKCFFNINQCSLCNRKQARLLTVYAHVGLNAGTASLHGYLPT